MHVVMSFLASQKLQAVQYAVTEGCCLCCAACLIMKQQEQQQQHDSGAIDTAATKGTACVSNLPWQMNTKWT